MKAGPPDKARRGWPLRTLATHSAARALFPLSRPLVAKAGIVNGAPPAAGSTHRTPEGGWPIFGPGQDPVGPDGVLHNPHPSVRRQSLPASHAPTVVGASARRQALQCFFSSVQSADGITWTEWRQRSAFTCPRGDRPPGKSPKADQGDGGPQGKFATPAARRSAPGTPVARTPPPPRWRATFASNSPGVAGE